MLSALLVATVFFGHPSVVSDAGAAPAAPPPAQTRRVGEKLEYTLSAVITQSIAGKDAFGRSIHQELAPTNVKGHESIAVTKTTVRGVTLHRSGTVTAVVQGAPPQTKFGQGWSLVLSSGTVARDNGKLGGLFLLPLPFLGSSAVRAGDDLAVGDRWPGKLGVKLYGMTAQPRLAFSVQSVRSVLGIDVYTVDAVGTVPMKEPVMTSGGEPLGYASGTARVTTEFDYDRANRRLISMQVEVRDTLHYSGPARRSGGSVKDDQRCLLALDPASINDGLPGAVDPVTPPQ